MKVKAALAAVVLAMAFAPTLAEAQVQVQGYYRSDGTYVRPHVRSSPDSSRSNNYGPSRSSPLYSPTAPSLTYVTPQSRDHDRDGIANMYDRDDDNDGIGDNRDRSQYGRTTPRRSGAWPN